MSDEPTVLPTVEVTACAPEKAASSGGIKELEAPATKIEMREVATSGATRPAGKEEKKEGEKDKDKKDEKQDKSNGSDPHAGLSNDNKGIMPLGSVGNANAGNRGTGVSGGAGEASGGSSSQRAMNILLDFSIQPISMVDYSDPNMTDVEKEILRELDPYWAEPGKEANPSDYYESVQDVFKKLVDASNTSDPQEFMEFIKINSGLYKSESGVAGEIVVISHIEGYLYNDRDPSSEEGPLRLDNPGLKMFYGTTREGKGESGPFAVPLGLPIPWSNGIKQVYRGYYGWISGKGKTIQFYLGFSTNKVL
jgi:hypothetical protein